MALRADALIVSSPCPQTPQKGRKCSIWLASHSRAQVAALRRQFAEPGGAPPAAKRKTTEHRRLYMRDLMRRRRAAAKAA
jgi:hypothetical protein